MEANGRTFGKMHVDGGITADILVVPEAVLTSRLAVNGAGTEICAIVNGTLGLTSRSSIRNCCPSSSVRLKQR